MNTAQITQWERVHFDRSLDAFPDPSQWNAAMAIVAEAGRAARMQQDELLARHTLDRADAALRALGSIPA